MKSKLIFLLLLTVAGGGCLEFPDEPVIPMWDVEVSASISKTSHTISDLVAELTALPPEILDTLYLPNVVLHYEETLVLGDTTGDGISDSKVTREFFQNVISATIFVETTNGTPVGLDISVALLDVDERQILAFPSGGQTVFVPGAPLDATGKVGPAIVETSAFELRSEEVDGMEGAELLRYSMDITFPEGVTVPNVLTVDSLNIRAWGTFITRVNP